MPTFITYASYSNAGVKGIVDKPTDRTEAIRTVVEKVGGKLVAAYMTTGTNDVVLVTELPDGSDAVAVGMAARWAWSTQRAELVKFNCSKGAQPAGWVARQLPETPDDEVTSRIGPPPLPHDGLSIKTTGDGARPSRSASRRRMICRECEPDHIEAIRTKLTLEVAGRALERLSL